MNYSLNVVLYHKFSNLSALTNQSIFVVCELFKVIDILSVAGYCSQSFVSYDISLFSVFHTLPNKVFVLIATYLTYDEANLVFQ
jgi:hypothetical protein